MNIIIFNPPLSLRDDKHREHANRNECNQAGRHRDTKRK